jgi:hypothetical protein
MTAFGPSRSLTGTIVHHSSFFFSPKANRRRVARLSLLCSIEQKTKVKDLSKKGERTNKSTQPSVKKTKPRSEKYLTAVAGRANIVKMLQNEKDDKVKNSLISDLRLVEAEMKASKFEKPTIQSGTMPAVSAPVAETGMVNSD